MYYFIYTSFGKVSRLLSGLDDEMMRRGESFEGKGVRDIALPQFIQALMIWEP